MTVNCGRRSIFQDCCAWKEPKERRIDRSVKDHRICARETRSGSDQYASLVSTAANAYNNDMGITSPAFTDTTVT